MRFFLLLCCIAILGAANIFLILFAKHVASEIDDGTDADAERILRAGTGGGTTVVDGSADVGAYYGYTDSVLTVFRYCGRESCECCLTRVLQHDARQFQYDKLLAVTQLYPNRVGEQLSWHGQLRRSLTWCLLQESQSHRWHPRSVACSDLLLLLPR